MNDRVYNREIERLRDPARVERLEVGRVIDLSLEGIAASSVIDVGTGSGLFAEAFANKGLSVTGIDIKNEMLVAAKEFVPNGEFKIGKAELIPFDDASFDLVFYGLVLHETDDLLQALKEGKRVARKGAVVLEWDYVIEEFGPPLEHRLSKDKVSENARLAGFQKVGRIRLKQLVLYRLC